MQCWLARPVIWRPYWTSHLHRWSQEVACGKPSPPASLRWTLNYLADRSSSPPAHSRGMGQTLTSNPPHISWLRKHPLSGKSRISTFHPNNTVLHNAMQQYKKKPNSLLSPPLPYPPYPSSPPSFSQGN